MSKITFDPWIGENYGKSHFGKLLIIGDSHYFTNGLPTDLKGFTKAKIAELPIISARFYDNIGKVISPDNPLALWDKVAFANAIQEPFTTSDQVPTTAQKDVAKMALKKYIELTKPDKVIVFSSRLWEHFFNTQGWGKHLDKIDNRWNIRELDYLGGTCEAIGLHHPSAYEFKVENMRKVVEDFLGR
ncbi:MAG: hypothetical protein JST62_00140 [Bacteroidetes bacterium]|jgi:hypothetical protein|nr:hypothetical protein [Bacteroidota bacterium]